MSVHFALLIVNIPKITRTMLLTIHKGGTMFSLFNNCSPFNMARKANITKDATDNKPDNHLGKRLVRKYPMPVMNIPRYIEDLSLIHI